MLFRDLGPAAVPHAVVVAFCKPGGRFGVVRQAFAKRVHLRLVETEIRRKLPKDRSKLAPAEQQPRGEDIGKRRVVFTTPLQVGGVAYALARETEVVRHLGAPRTAD